MKIHRAFNRSDKFSFYGVTEDEVRKEMLKLDDTKVNPDGGIPAGMLKSTVYIHVSSWTKMINLSFRNGCFLDNLNPAEVSPVFKKNDDSGKENHRPVGV